MVFSNDIRAMLLPKAFNAVLQAGAEIMSIYGTQSQVVLIKNDNSPYTLADTLAHNKIKEVLGSTRIPILSEEGREMHFEERENWEMFWLVDPLDGTAEFIKRNDEFTVNIALVCHNIPIAAMVYVPCLQKIYIAERGVGACLIENVAPKADAQYTMEQVLAMRMQKLPLATSHEEFVIALSRSHQTPETEKYVQAQKSKHDNVRIIEQGSSYKFCLLAEGVVDYYPRTTHTYEWDTAAAELILAQAGGITRSIPDGEPLKYNKEDLRNPYFESFAPQIR